MKTNRFLVLVAYCIAACFWAGSVHAVESTWTDGVGNGLWSEAGNWSNGVPGNADEAIFDGTSSADCTIDQAVDVKALRIETGYGGTVSQGASVITLGSVGFVQQAGIFTGGDGAITLNGNFSQSGGTFTSTSGRLSIPSTFVARVFTRTGGVFNHNGGEVYFYFASLASPVTLTSGGCAFYDFTVDYGAGTNAQLTPTDSFSVEGNFRFLGNRTSSQGSRINPSGPVTVTLHGDLIKEDGYNIILGNVNLTFLLAQAGQTVYCGQGGIGGTLLCQGSSPLTITNDVIVAGTNRNIYGLTADKTAGSVMIATDVKIYRLQVEVGNTLDASGSDIWPDTTGLNTAGGYYIRNYGTITNAVNELNIDILGSSSFYLYSGSLVWDKVTIPSSANTSSDFTLEDNITVIGDLVVEVPLLRGGFFKNTGNFTISVGGDLHVKTGTGAFADSSDTVQLNGAGTQTVTVVHNGTFDPKLEVAGGATAVLGTNLTYGASATVETGGTLDLNGYDFSAGGGLDVSGTLRRRGNESVTTPTLNAGSIVRYVGDVAPVTVANWSYQTLAIEGPGKQFNWTAGDTYSAAEGFVAAGDNANKVTLRSTIPSTTWSINTSGATQAVAYVDVQDATALGPEIVARSSVDSDRNVNWDFPGPPGTVVSIK